MKIGKWIVAVMAVSGGWFTLSCRAPEHHPHLVASRGTESTMDVAEITPQQAKKLLDSNQGYVYLDVRTESEFAAGHVPDAWNIPVAQMDPAGGGMVLNPDFLAVVRANLPLDAKVVCGCRSGSRSEMAVRILLEAGYQGAVNMEGGFAGQTDATGEVLVEGWSTLGYPVSHGDDRGRTHAEIRAAGK